ncbi:MAG: hypothetical protein KJ907_02190 [Actinobacteria bacterium]|nr:hypothetical protein [Actinomycetota bacterium]
MNRQRWRELMDENKDTLLGIVYTLVGIVAVIGVSFLVVWAIVSIIE